MPTRKASSQQQQQHHSRRHSWPPFSTRHLLAVAPVHFHLSPSGSKKRAAATSTTPFGPSSSSSSAVSQRPPTPYVTVSPPTPPEQPSPLEQQPSSSLPDIDDDPFAHFLSPMSDEDDPYDELSFSAGIIPSDDSATDEDDDVAGGEWDADETRRREDDKLRSKLARRWAKYIAKYRAAAAAEEEEERWKGDGQEQRKRRNDEVAVTDEGYMSEEGSTPMHVRKPQRPGPEPTEPYRTIVREPTKGRAQDLVDGRMRKRRKHRHSWRAPDHDLFTVVEEGEGAVDSEIEQRYFST
ncbi:hypothetical protein SLS54_002145 [Diplodia seriata]